MRSYLRRFVTTFMVGLYAVQIYEAVTTIAQLLPALGASEPKPVDVDVDELAGDDDPDELGHLLAEAFTEQLGVPCHYDPDTHLIYAEDPAGAAQIWCDEKPDDCGCSPVPRGEAGEVVPWADRPLQPDVVGTTDAEA